MLHSKATITGIALVVHVLVMRLVKNAVMVTVQVMKPVTAVQKIVRVFLKNGHVQMATTLIHGVTVDVVLMIQYVMIRMQVSGITAVQMVV